MSPLPAPVHLHAIRTLQKASRTSKGFSERIGTKGGTIRAEGNRMKRDSHVYISIARRAIASYIQGRFT